jgi:CheY-specific phosphatase CheX
MAIKDIASQVITRILADAAFIFTDALSDKEKPDVADWDADGVSLRFKGTPSGELRMWVSKGFACYVAANMLGIDADSDESRQKGLDALKELLNMIVGNFITAAYGDKPVFALGLPKNLLRTEMEKDFSCTNTVWLEAEGNQILFVMEIA